MFKVDISAVGVREGLSYIHREGAAVRFGTAVASSPKGIADEEFEALRAHFSPEEIVELSCWISFMYGAEMFGAIMKLDPATDAVKKMYATWLVQGKQQALKAAA